VDGYHREPCAGEKHGKLKEEKARLKLGKMEKERNLLLEEKY
jgi:hypothetical protein